MSEYYIDIVWSTIIDLYTKSFGLIVSNYRFGSIADFVRQMTFILDAGIVNELPPLEIDRPIYAFQGPYLLTWIELYNRT